MRENNNMNWIAMILVVMSILMFSIMSMGYPSWFTIAHETYWVQMSIVLAGTGVGVFIMRHYSKTQNETNTLEENV